MTANDIRQKYLDFFVKRGHTVIPSAPLVPLNDPTTLFTGSGMQPMIPYLLGETHPEGTRLVDSQKSFRSQDIEEVGDNRHTTFFEMLGNWSLGDYFKAEQIEWIFDFLTDKSEGIGLDPHKLFVSVFRGKSAINIPADDEAVGLWQSMFTKVNIDAKAINFPEKNGMQSGRIFYYDEAKNWWSRAGVTANMPVGEPGGPDSEVFYDFGPERKLHENSPFKHEPCHPNCDCGRFLEIANNVFMAYKKTNSGFEPLSQKNIDFGGGLERLAAAVNHDPDVFKTDLFAPIISKIETVTGKKYADDDNQTAMRVIADHIKAAAFLIADGVLPGNKTQGYVLRRLLRRAAIKLRNLGRLTNEADLTKISEGVIDIYRDSYLADKSAQENIKREIKDEVIKFNRTLEKGLKQLERVETVDGKEAFDLYQTYGFPWELTVELATKKGQIIDRLEFETAFKKHQDQSRSSAKGMFKGGLADNSQQTIKLHTAHHLLLAALQQIVDPSIKQRGSNITAERLRLDFNLNRTLTDDEKQQIEQIINQKIAENVPVQRVDMKRNVAEKLGAQMEFGAKYPDTVSVYFIGLKTGVDPHQATKTDFFSAEFCGGPHVSSTGEIGGVTMKKVESIGGDTRRIYAALKS